MAVTPVKYVVQLIDKSTGLVRAGVNVKITNDGGASFLPSGSGVNTDANGIAVIDVSLIGAYAVYVDGVLNTDYQDQTVIPLEGNNIRCVDTDGDFGSSIDIVTGNPTVGNNGIITSDTAVQIYRNTAGVATQASFNDPSGKVGAIVTSAGATIYQTTSDPRKKTEFTYPSKTEIWDKFSAIKTAFGKFFWKHDTQQENEIWGFDAHSLIDNLGDAGVEGEGGRDLDIGVQYKKPVIDKKTSKVIDAGKVTPAGVDQSKIVPYLVACIEDMRKRIEKLEA